MRHIDISKLVLPAGWEEKAKALSKLLEDAKTKEERDKILDEQPIWQDLSIPLSILSEGKCWYSEAKELMSDRDVDHFRPKNESKGLTKKNCEELSVDSARIESQKRDGYWWLAYYYKNYRFSSIYSNRRRRDKRKNATGGKSSYFPLFKDSLVAKDKNRLKDEDIVLLDPIEEDDVALVTFDSTGDVIPNTTNDQEIIRVKVSKNLYHLDHTPLKEERAKIWNICQRYINEIDTIKSQKILSITDRNRLGFLKGELKRMMSRDEELSAVAIACCEANELNYLTRA